jgi:hypothetical protein
MVIMLVSARFLNIYSSQHVLAWASGVGASEHPKDPGLWIWSNKYPQIEVLRMQFSTMGMLPDPVA